MPQVLYHQTFSWTAPLIQANGFQPGVDGMTWLANRPYDSAQRKAIFRVVFPDELDLSIFRRDEGGWTVWVLPSDIVNAASYELIGDVEYDRLTGQLPAGYTSPRTKVTASASIQHNVCDRRVEVVCGAGSGAADFMCWAYDHPARGLIRIQSIEPKGDPVTTTMMASVVCERLEPLASAGAEAMIKTIRAGQTVVAGNAPKDDDVSSELRQAMQAAVSATWRLGPPRRFSFAFRPSTDTIVLSGVSFARSNVARYYNGDGEEHRRSERPIDFAADPFPPHGRLSSDASARELFFQRNGVNLDDIAKHGFTAESFFDLHADRPMKDKVPAILVSFREGADISPWQASPNVFRPPGAVINRLARMAIKL